MTDAGAQLGNGTQSPSDLETELTILGSFLKQVGAYHAALLNTVASVAKQSAANPNTSVSMVDAMASDPQLAQARAGFRSGLADLKKLKTIDPQTYAAVEQSFGTPRHTSAPPTSSKIVSTSSPRRCSRTPPPRALSA